MSGRRSHPRFVVADGTGVLKVARDVGVTTAADELIAMSTEPAPVGEAVTIELTIDGATDQIAVRVESSNPVVVGATIRYRIRLSREHRGAPADPPAGIQHTPWLASGTLRLVRGNSRAD